MTDEKISVVIASKPGCVDQVERCLSGFARETPFPLELLVEEGATAIECWEHGSVNATGEYLMFASDELEPHPGWWEDAIATVRAGYIPAAVLWLPDGECLPPAGARLCDWAPSPDGVRFPFSRREDARPFFLNRQAEFTAVVRTGYAFTWWRD